MDICTIKEFLHNDPFGFLGIHEYQDKFIIRVLNTHAYEILVCDENSQKKTPLVKDGHGIFTGIFKSQIIYFLEIHYSDHVILTKDPYSFLPVISDCNLYLFQEGTHRKVWNMMGSHPISHQNADGFVFALWAPNAKSVRLIGDFNHWDKEQYYMRPRAGCGIWEIFIPNLHEGMKYKYVIETQDNKLVEKCDPYGNYAEKRPNTASILYDINGFEWNDNEWMDNRTQCKDKALSIYECHLDTWLRTEDNQPLNYDEIAMPLVEYLLEHQFTHIELMPITEYPYDGSWGYQVTGYYAATARYGTPKDFMYFVDYLHKNDIGIIMDWVPAHFPIDSHGLAQFDGTSLYEHHDSRLGWHNDWNTYIFNYGRNEVRQFLIGSALYWLDKFHIDGLRVDAVASMLYLDYSRKEGEWIPNQYGGRENLQAIEFIQSLHAEINRYFPTVMTIAEESTSFIGVTKPTEEGGLGFTYKWNMGWMNDTLSYFSVDPLFRPWHHQEITFSLIYAFTEHFILPFSHDEVVHGKGTLLSRMPGGEWEKFANLRLMYSYMWGHPGKKLLFAGQEWAPWDEWNEKYSIDWHLNSYIYHIGMRNLIRDLNILYRNMTALSRLDQDPKTFMWLDCDNNRSGLLMWIRRDNKDNKVLIILNLNTIVKEKWIIGVPYQGTYEEIFNSDSSNYGGANVLNDQYITAENMPYQNQSYSLKINIGPLAAVLFEINN